MMDLIKEIAKTIAELGDEVSSHPDKVARVYAAKRLVELEVGNIMSELREKERATFVKQQ